MKGPAATVIERCDILADISEEPGVLVQPYSSRAMREVNDVVSGWMREAGMTPRRDGIGNLTGRYEGSDDKTLILGSHLDTARDAGKYNGTLGVMAALACVRRLPSGAGHDMAQVAALTPAAMLFVRCEEGISHNPAESVTREDVEAAIEVKGRFLELVAEAEGPSE